jgi:hypothetical protein
MTVARPVTMPGAPAAELAVMREAAAEFARRFGGTPAGLGMLAGPFPAPAVAGRETYVRNGPVHDIAPAAVAGPAGRAMCEKSGGMHWYIS